MNKSEIIITNSGKPNFPLGQFLALEKKGLGHSYKPEVVKSQLSVSPLGILGFAALTPDFDQVLGVSYLYPRKVDGNDEDRVCIVDHEGLKIKTFEGAIRDAFSQSKEHPVYELELGGSYVLPEAQGNGVYKNLVKSRLEAIIELSKKGLTDNGQLIPNEDIFVTLCSKGAHEGNQALQKIKKNGSMTFTELESIGRISPDQVGQARQESLATSHMAEQLGMKLIAISSNNLGPIYAVRLKDLVEKLSPLKNGWGFPNPTILIDSQSSPALKGIEPEQRYYRLYLMGKSEDVVVVDYPIDQTYLNYLKKDLKLSLPAFIQIQNVGGQTLSENILAQEGVVDNLKKLVAAGYKMQFFNLNGDEIDLAKSLANPSYIKDLDLTSHLGTKVGFREFCIANGIPMPKGQVCNSEEEAEKAVAALKSDVVIKSSKGTGGKELGSNQVISYFDYLKDKTIIRGAVNHLTPSEPPYVVEQKLELPEASLHIFIDDDGKVIVKPVAFGQFAHDQSYNGGHYPNDFPEALNEKILKLANSFIVPALQKIGATGFHCMDFLYDKTKGDVFFIEDNTRPGALDFIHHFVTRVVEANFKDAKYSWYHKLLSLKELGVKSINFSEIYEAIGDLLNPALGGFALISNPDVLPYGYDLHLTAVVTGKDSSQEEAKKVYKSIVDELKSHYGNK